MKHLRKVMALVLAAVMAVVIGVAPALAADPVAHKITITNTNTNMSIDGKTYNAYKLFDSTHIGTAYAYSMPTSSQFYSDDLLADPAPTTDSLAKVLRTYFTFEAVPGDTTKVNVKNINYPNEMTAAQARAFADAIQPYIASMSPTASGTASGETAVINLPTDAAGVGYYIVTGDVKPKDPANPADTVVSAVILTNEDPTATIKPKASVPPFNKKTTKVTEGTTVVDNALLDNKGKAAVAKVGSTVSYELETTIPDLTGYSKYTFKFGDAITPGLDYVKTSFYLKVGTADPVSVTPTFADDNKSFTYTFPYETLLTYQNQIGAKVVLTYDCTVNDNALTYDYENNTASLTYSRSPYDDVENETPKQKTYVIDLNLDVDKVNAAGDKLTGAKFKLYRGTTTKEFYKWDATAKKVTWTTEADADVFETQNGKLKQQVRGLDKGTYFFLETEPPTGYNLLTQPVQVDITVVEDANGETVTYTAKYGNKDATVTNGAVTLTTETQAEKQPVAEGTILNQSGTELPSTGGMGTTILYTIGGIMLVGGAIALVSKKRVANMEK